MDKRVPLSCIASVSYYRLLSATMSVDPLHELTALDKQPLGELGKVMCFEARKIVGRASGQ